MMINKISRFLILFLFLFSCTKDPRPPQRNNTNNILLSTLSVENITNSSATSGGDITNDGGTAITAKGVCWSTSTNPTLSNSSTNDGTGIGTFSSSLFGLTGGTNYYVRAYATNSSGTTYGNEHFFTTNPTTQATITTSSITSITQTSAISGGTIINDGGATVTARGVCWSTSTNPTLFNSSTNNGTGIGSFSSTMSSLIVGTTYYVRAYATNSVGTTYGNQINFVTTAASLPVISTTTVTSISQNTANTGGNVTSDGGATVTSRGVCWSTTANPTISNSTTSNGSGIGSFSSSLTGLIAGTTYYVRAYATNAAGTAYGNQLAFPTSTVTIPVLTTTSISSITQTSANSGGIITSGGSSTVTSRGICWNTTGNPTTANSTTSNGTGTGSFSSSLTGLIAGITYYVRAYAINGAGTAYGNQVSFQTSASLPVLTTTSISSITQTTSNSGGTVTNDGGATVTTRGVCWNTTGNPTTSNSTTSNGSGTGSFSSAITGLTTSTTYYVRAYATNSAGTSYGNQVNFTTSAGTTLQAPTLTSPSNGAATICCYINYAWTVAAGATSYEFQLSKNSSFPTSGMVTISICGGSSSPTTVAVNDAIVNTTTFCTNSGGSSNNGIWYWRVRAISGSTQGPWSSVFTHVFTW